MKIYTAEQIRAWDEYTIRHEPIDSTSLMDRASAVFTEWFMRRFPAGEAVVFAGTGNNGGDGLAVARFLSAASWKVRVIVCEFGGRRSPDFQKQLDLLQSKGMVPVEWATPALEWTFAPPSAVLIDALFGSGLNRPLDGVWSDLIGKLNALPNTKTSIDIPSGMFADRPAEEPCLRADAVLTFERPKRSFFFPESAPYLGAWDYASIGLHPGFEKETSTPYRYLTLEEVRTLYKPRPRFAHKGGFGHALILAGSRGKTGAAVLAARACLRAGAGLTSVALPACGLEVLQTAAPEAMCLPDECADHLSLLPDPGVYQAMAAGPGLGKHPDTAKVVEGVLCQAVSPVVLDADALNLLAEHPDWWEVLPKGSILTPHPKEFERLFGKSVNGFARNALQIEKAAQFGIYIILKGANTAVACPDGRCWYNSTGNPGMATGGSGDVLTGILAGLLASGYSPEEACLLGVWLHGAAGDLAAAESSMESLIAGDIVEYLGKAWRMLYPGY